MIETLEEYLVEQVRVKQSHIVHDLLQEWDGLSGQLPTFQKYILVNMEELWLSWVRRN